MMLFGRGLFRSRSYVMRQVTQNRTFGNDKPFLEGQLSAIVPSEQTEAPVHIETPATPTIKLHASNNIGLPLKRLGMVRGQGIHPFTNKLFKSDSTIIQQAREAANLKAELDLKMNAGVKGASHVIGVRSEHEVHKSIFGQSYCLTHLTGEATHVHDELGNHLVEPFQLKEN